MESNINDPFDPANLRLDQNFAEKLGAKSILTHIKVRSKPPGQEFVRVWSEPTKRMNAAILEWQAEKELYLVAPGIFEAIANHARQRLLLPTITAASNEFFFWALKVTPPGEKENTWNVTANNAAAMAEKKWINVNSNTAIAAYETREAEGEIPEPVWPSLSMTELLRLAFKDKFIDSLDHPIVKKLKGVI